MNHSITLEKMNKLRLLGMAEYLKNALDIGSIHEFKADQFTALLVEAEYEDKFNRRLQRLVRNANFKIVAHLEEVNYKTDRNLKKSQIAELSSLKWMEKGTNLMITGFTGTGKTFLACAFGMKACMQGWSVGYFAASKLFYQLKYAKSCGNYIKEFAKIASKELIIIDDFGLEHLDKESRMGLFEILEERSCKKSLIISSQLPPDQWFDIIGDKTLADAICDRLLSNSHFINLEGPSMRQDIHKKS